MTLLIALTPPQERIFDATVTDLANRAAASELPFEEYWEGLCNFVFADTGTRVRMMKTNNELFLMLKLDEGKLMNIIALRSMPNADAQAFLRALLIKLKNAVKAEL